MCIWFHIYQEKIYSYLAEKREIIFNKQISGPPYAPYTDLWQCHASSIPSLFVPERLPERNSITIITLFLYNKECNMECNLSKNIKG